MRGRATEASREAYTGAMTHHNSARRMKAPTNRSRKSLHVALSDWTNSANPTEPAGGDDSEEKGLPDIEVSRLEPSRPVASKRKQAYDAEQIDQVKHHCPEQKAY